MRPVLLYPTVGNSVLWISSHSPITHIGNIAAVKQDTGFWIKEVSDCHDIAYIYDHFTALN